MKLIKENSYLENKKRILEAKKAADIDVKNEGILEVPEGKKVDELPLSHFEKLVDKKGYVKVIRALNNLQVWNKNDDKSLSTWAKSTMDKLKKKYRKDEFYLKEESEEDNQPIWGVWQRGGSIGFHDFFTSVGLTKAEAIETAKSLRKFTTPGEREYYGIGYSVKKVPADLRGLTPDEIYDRRNQKTRESLEEAFFNAVEVISFPDNDPKVGDKFETPRGRHVVREIFKNGAEAKNTPGYGYWFTTDDDWDIFAFEGNGYSVGVAPSWLKRRSLGLKEGINASDWDEIYKLAKEGGLNTIEDLHLLAKEYPNMPIKDALKRHATEFKTGKDPYLEESISKVQTIVDKDIKEKDVVNESISEEDLEIIYSIIDKYIRNTETKERRTYDKSGYNSDRSKATQGSIDRLLNLKKEIGKLVVKEDLTEDVVDPKEIAPTPETPNDNALTLLLNKLMISEYDAIDDYNSSIAAAKELGREDIVDILTTIAHDENTHVGNLLVATKLVNPQTQAVDKGEQQAIDTLEGDTVIEESYKKYNKKWVTDDSKEVTKVILKDGSSLERGQKIKDLYITGFDPETNTVYLDKDKETDGGSDYEVEDVLSLIKENK